MSTHETVADNWARQTSRAKRGFNMFYEGPTIFSYGFHFPIARFVDPPNGARVVLFTTAGYSKSTSQHKGIARAAINGVAEVLEVEDPAAESQLFNWRQLRNTLPGLVKQRDRARSNKAMRQRQIDATIRTMNRLNKLFDLQQDVISSPEQVQAA